MSRFKKGYSYDYYEGKRRKGKSKKSRKRDKFFDKVTKDNKISKKEAKKMRKKGYSERDLDRYDAKAYYRAKKSRARNAQSYRRQNNFPYEPLVKSKGAYGQLRGKISSSKSSLYHLNII